jgi:uncharacterized membrane protein YedE/YeeE
MKNLVGLIAGLIFGLGLIISGMADPAKVQNFLDIFGTWDPSLAFVMGGAIAITMPGFWLVTRRSKPFFHHAFHMPTSRDLDARLLSGAAVFGVGWGLGGFCPGPALTALPVGASGTLIFVPMMLIGMLVSRRMNDRAPKIAQA